VKHAKEVFAVISSLTVLVAVLVSSFVGCTRKGIKPLTDDEKDVMIEIALNHPDVVKWLGEPDTYKTEVGWIALGWNDGEATGWARLEYEEIADGNLPSDRTFPSETVTINPGVLIRVGEPERKHILAAFDRETKEIVHVEPLPILPR
jgi:hypothetical protein